MKKAKKAKKVTKVTKAKQPEVRLEIIYSAEFFPEGDRRVCKAVGRQFSDASGMGLGQRDQAFYFKSYVHAKNAAKRVKLQCGFVDQINISEEI